METPEDVLIHWEPGNLMPFIREKDFEKVKFNIERNLVSLSVVQHEPLDLTLMHLAVIHDRIDLLVFLLEKIPELARDININGLTPLMMACMQKPIQMPIVEALVQKAPETIVTSTSEDDTPEPNFTALHFLASFNDTVPAMEVLLKNGADINYRRVFGNTPLEAAVLAQKVENVKFLLENNAEVSDKAVMVITQKRWDNDDSWEILLCLLNKFPEKIKCSYVTEYGQVMDRYSNNLFWCLPVEDHKEESLLTFALRDASEEQAKKLMELFLELGKCEPISTDYFHNLMAAYMIRRDIKFRHQTLTEAIRSHKNELATKIMNLTYTFFLHVYEAADSENEFMFDKLLQSLGPPTILELSPAEMLQTYGAVAVLKPEEEYPLVIAVQKRSLKAIKFIKKRAPPSHYKLHWKHDNFHGTDIVTDDRRFKDLHKTCARAAWNGGVQGNLISLALCNRILSERFDDTTFEILKHFTEEGVPLNNSADENIIPALSLMTYVHRAYLSDHQVLQFHKMFDYLLEKGADPTFSSGGEKDIIDGMTLSTNEQFGYNSPGIDSEHYAGIKYLKMNHDLPDALLLSFLSANVGAIFKLLPYWKAPPAALILAAPLLKYSEYFLLMLKYLLPFGLPHGTELFRRVEERVKDFEPARRDFDQMTASPFTLQTLAALTIRNACQVKAKDLPRTLEKLVPKLTQPYLTLKRKFRNDQDSTVLLVEQDKAIHQEMNERYQAGGKSLLLREPSADTICVYRYACIFKNNGRLI